MLVYSALLAQYNVCMQCLQSLFNSIYRAPTLWLIQAQANLKLVSDQSESDRSETQLKICSGPHCQQKTTEKTYFQCARLGPVLHLASQTPASQNAHGRSRKASSRGKSNPPLGPAGPRPTTFPFAQFQIELIKKNKHPPPAASRAKSQKHNRKPTKSGGSLACYQRTTQRNIVAAHKK